MVKFLKKFLIIFVFTLAIFSTAFAEEKEIDIKKLSESLGHIIGKNLDDLGFKLDLKNMLKGIKKGSQKKLSPMSEDECLEALAQIQIQENEKKTSQNLKDATFFLITNLKDKDVIEIEKGKLQYKILKKGKPQKVETYHNPIVKMTGRYLDDKIFTTSEETINLAETLPALQKAIVGMNLHEKRKVFIHPDLVFGKNSPHLNSLVIFDIEVLTLDAKKDPLSEISNNKIVL
ncbi:MAG: Outer membrane protein MIP [Candidatus Anoxychlamydiales bacterium]|nr:Outer membrane protein MIP [Candidatus Anoxychlamydiales bacterium]